MNKNKIPSNWANLVKKSSEHLIDKIHDVPVTKTWLFPDVEHGNFAMQEVTNNNQTLAKNTGNIVHTSLPHSSRPQLSSQHELNFSQQSMANNIGISQEYSIPSIQPTLDSVAPSQDDFFPPPPINLETSGLWNSPRITALNNSNAPAISAYVTSTMPVTSRQYTRPKQRLSFYSVFNLVGSLWTFAMTSSHYDVETYSFVAEFSNNYDRLNGLFDDTINVICHQIHA